jgi:uncharacterized membrane protein
MLSNMKHRFFCLYLCYGVFLALYVGNSCGIVFCAQAFSIKMKRSLPSRSDNRCRHRNDNNYSPHIASTRDDSPWTSYSSLHCRNRLDMASSSSNEISPGIGEAGCQLRSPSGVNTMKDTTQAAVFIGILLALGLCTTLFNALLSSLTVNYEWLQSFRYSWPIVLGLVYMAAGVTHFTVADQYKNIYPYQGAWGGLWKIPGSADFHVAWTGVAELVGGLGLLVGGLIDWLAVPVYNISAPTIFTSAGLESDCAAALYLLTWTVTPANIFMFTHGAKLPMEVEGEIPILFHVVRFMMQVILLGFLYQLGEGTFVALLG